LETALALTLRLVEEGVLSLDRAVQCLTSKPARLMGSPAGTLTLGASADIAVVDRARDWVVDPDRVYSKGRNTPFAGWSMRGRVMMAVVGGRIRYRGSDAAYVVVMRDVRAVGRACIVNSTDVRLLLQMTCNY
jgi:dihydroorotase